MRVNKIVQNMLHYHLAIISKTIRENEWGKCVVKNTFNSKVSDLIFDSYWYGQVIISFEYNNKRWKFTYQENLDILLKHKVEITSDAYYTLAKILHHCYQKESDLVRHNYDIEKI